LTDQQLAASLGGFSRRRPFRQFLIEFSSGAQIEVRHPEAVAPSAGVWLLHEPNGRWIAFASSSVCRLLDAPPGEHVESRI
jgi:hypothetical protein